MSLINNSIYDTIHLQNREKISVRHLQSENEFSMLDDLYQKCFSEHSVPTYRQKEWWSKSNKSILGLFNENELIGGISFWSLNVVKFEKLKTGLLQERDITSDDFEFQSRNHYYLSDLAIAEDYRQNFYSNLLLSALLEQIKSDANNSLNIDLLAFAFSKIGSKILGRLGFKKIKDESETLDKLDLYLLHLESYIEIADIIKCLE